MTYYLGIDIGTSAVKTVLVDEDQRIICEATSGYDVSYPQALWAEQPPERWWKAVCETIDRIKSEVPASFAATQAIGLSGQMHGAVFIDEENQPLRPAILWNDGRSHKEADALYASSAKLADIAGVMPMVGFLAPKIAWLRNNEPEIFERTSRFLLPKDYIRFKLTGGYYSDMSDAAGSWLLDEVHRCWSGDILRVVGIREDQLPELVEGNQITGEILPELRRHWGFNGNVMVVGGAGDCAAAAVGAGIINEGDTLLSIGTSAVLFTPTPAFRPSPPSMVHAFCHALPERWFQMAVMLNGGSALLWAAQLLGETPGGLAQLVEKRFNGPSETLFLPYLTGERSPHNDPYAKGVFFGMNPISDKGSLAQAVMEGVAFSFTDAKDSMTRTGTTIDSVYMLGGGAKSRVWTQIISSVLNVPINRCKDTDSGPAFGAARLARLAVTGESPETVCIRPEPMDTLQPDPELVEAYAPRMEQFKRLYLLLKEEFRRTGQAI